MNFYHFLVILILQISVQIINAEQLVNLSKLQNRSPKSAFKYGFRAGYSSAMEKINKNLKLDFMDDSKYLKEILDGAGIDMFDTGRIAKQLAEVLGIGLPDLNDGYEMEQPWSNQQHSAPTPNYDSFPQSQHYPGYNNGYDAPGSHPQQQHAGYGSQAAPHQQQYQPPSNFYSGNGYNMPNNPQAGFQGGFPAPSGMSSFGGPNSKQ